MATWTKSVTGRQSRAAGEYFENLINAAAGFYQDQKVAVVEKTPEPMKILKPHDRSRGQFIACFAKQAQPDYKGILQDGTMILFDAKHTDSDQLKRSVVTAEQEEEFDRYQDMGARCYIVASVGFQNFYRIPWETFRDMKRNFGRLHMKLTDLEKYRIPFSRGYVLFLEGIELKETGDEG